MSEIDRGKTYNKFYETDEAPTKIIFDVKENMWRILDDEFGEEFIPTDDDLRAFLDDQIEGDRRYGSRMLTVKKSGMQARGSLRGACPLAKCDYYSDAIHLWDTPEKWVKIDMPDGVVAEFFGDAFSGSLNFVTVNKNDNANWIAVLCDLCERYKAASREELKSYGAMAHAFAEATR